MRAHYFFCFVYVRCYQIISKPTHVFHHNQIENDKKSKFRNSDFFSFLNLEGWKFLKFAVNVQVTFDDFLAEFTAILCYLELWTYIIFFENIKEQYYF